MAECSKYHVSPCLQCKAMREPQPPVEQDLTALEDSVCREDVGLLELEDGTDGGQASSRGRAPWTSDRWAVVAESDQPLDIELAEQLVADSISLELPDRLHQESRGQLASPAKALPVEDAGENKKVFREHFSNGCANWFARMRAVASRSFFEVFGSCRSEHKDSLSPSRFCGGRGRLSGKMGMEDALELFVTYLQPLLPDWLVRFLVRIVLGHALRQLWKLRWPQKELRLVSRVKQLASEEIAFDTAAANEQHYEVPTPFFLNSLGPRLKYSSCEWPGPDATLAEAETHTLAKYTELLGVADGQRVLDIGCGWGSFSLYAAERFPKTTFVCFSNSSTQIAHISSEASRRGLANLTALKMDINSLSAAALEERGGLPLYDRIFACESLEHSRNYQALFARIAKVLAPDGRFFVQILGHREYSYLMNAKSWMGRRFFTGGTLRPTVDSFDDVLSSLHRRPLCGT
eukprot:s19_g11.t6